MVNTLLPYTHQAGVPQVSELVKYISTNEEITKKKKKSIIRQKSILLLPTVHCKNR